MFDFKPLLTLQFWFDKKPPVMMPVFQQSFFYFFGALVVLSLIITVLIRPKKKTDPWVAKGFQKVSSWCLTMGIAGLIIFFFSFEQVPFLSMRFWYIVWLIAAVAWLVWVVRFFVKVVPAEKAKIRQKKELEKYIPKSK